MLRTEEVATPARSSALRRSRYACVARGDLRRYAPHLFISISYESLSFSTQFLRASAIEAWRFSSLSWPEMTDIARAFAGR
jgi:hypothetical protein